MPSVVGVASLNNLRAVVMVTAVPSGKQSAQLYIDQKVTDRGRRMGQDTGAHSLVKVPHARLPTYTLSIKLKSFSFKNVMKRDSWGDQETY
jgi:hypothetical protein